MQCIGWIHWNHWSWQHCTNLYRRCFKHEKCDWPSSPLFSKSLFSRLCCSCCMDLLLEDWGKVPWVKWIVKKVKIVVSFIRQHHMPLVIFCHYKTNLMLLNPTKTWFATNFLMVERLFKVKLTIEQIVVDLDWTIFVNSLHGSHCQKSLTKMKTIWANVRKDEFLDTCANFVHMVEPVSVSLKAFDDKQPCMGRVWLIMKILEWHVLSLQDPLFKLPSNLVDVIEDRFSQRWKMLTIDLHYVRAFFNPYLLGENCLHDDAEEALNIVLWKITHTSTAYALALKDFANFVENWSPFFWHPLVKDLEFLPHKWWDLIGIGGHTVVPIICHILVQMCSTSSCEHNWSSYSFVHSKVRNRLSSNWAKDLVYIYTNSKLLQKWPCTNPTTWHEKNIVWKIDV